MLFSLENVKVVVQCDEALVFSPFQKEAQEFIQYLQKDIQNSDQNKNKVNLINPSSRFELAVIEAGVCVCMYVCMYACVIMMVFFSLFSCVSYVTYLIYMHIYVYMLM